MGLFDRFRNFLASKFGTSTSNNRRSRYSTTSYERPRLASERSSTRATTSTTNSRRSPSPNSPLNATSTPSNHQVKYATTRSVGRVNQLERPCSNNIVTRTNIGKLSSASSTTGSAPSATKRPLADSTLKAYIHTVQSHSPPEPGHSIYNERYTGNFSNVYSIPQPTQHRYSVRNLTFKLESLPKDQSFTPQSNTLYHNQWTTCNAIVVDESCTNYQVNTTCEVEITSQCIQFRNIKLVNGQLQFRMKASDAGNDATIIFTINKLTTITKDVYVNYNPPSSVLSEMTIKELHDSNHHTRENTFILRVSVNDVFGDPALRKSEKNCVFKAIVSESEDDDGGVEIEKRICPDHHLHFDLSLRRSELWSEKLKVFLNEEEIGPAQTFEVPDQERITLLKWRSEALEENDCESIPDCLVFDNSRVFIPIPTDVEERKFVPHDDERCQIQALPGGGYELVCKNTSKHVILGADCAHINNIKRVLQLKEHLEIQESSTEASIIFDHGNVSLHHLRGICKAVLLHLLRGSYYRDKASEAARARMEWKRRVEAFDESADLKATVKLCMFFKDHFGVLMNKYNREACEELFSFFNYNRDDSEVDLHGLLVADEERLELLRLDILRENLSDEEIERTIRNCRLKAKFMKKDLMAGRLSADEVNQFIDSGEVHYVNTELETLRKDLLRRCDRAEHVDGLIKSWRAVSDEAIRKLKETLEMFDLANAVENNSPWIEIIVGAGHHSKKKKKQNIRPKVEKFLKEKGNQFTPVNRGSLVVTFIEYSGPEPCFGEYYCVQCDRCWKSSKSYTGKYQKCSRCHVKCWPVKQREKERIPNYRREGEEERRKSKPHQSSLCQKCQELGYPCNEDD